MIEERTPAGTVIDRADGRTARSQRTRAALLDALEALIREETGDLGARRVAERAGVSVRTVFAHFASLDDLHTALVARVRQRVLGLLTPIDPTRPLTARVRDLCTQRGRVAEEIGPFRRLAARREEGSTVLATARDDGRTASRQQIERVFAPELAPLAREARARRAGAVDALVSGETWDLLRTVHGLSPADAAAATGAAVSAVLTAGAAVDGRAGAARLADARVVVADADLRIARLVAAIEAGAPAEVVGPRLAELRAVRDEAAAEVAMAAGAGHG